MVKESRYRKKARAILAEIVAENPQKEGESLEAWGRRLKRAIAAESWSDRGGWVYQCWCRERGKLLFDLGINKTLPKRTPSGKKAKARAAIKAAALENQLSLFPEVPPVPAGNGKDPSRIQPPLWKVI